MWTRPTPLKMLVFWVSCPSTAELPVLPLREGQCLKTAEGSFEVFWKHGNIMNHSNRDFDHLLY